MNEQWKTSGNCAECRRRDYCKTICKASKNRMRSLIYSVASQKIAERLNKKSQS